MPHVATVGQDEILNLASARVRGLHNAEDARAVPPAGGEIGIERVASEIRIHGQRVGERGVAVRRLEERGGIRARRRADVAAFCVHDHLQPRRAGVAADLLESAHPVRAERFEEGDLGFHRNNVRRDRIDESAAEARARIGRLRPPEHRKQVSEGFSRSQGS